MVHLHCPLESLHSTFIKCMFSRSGLGLLWRMLHHTRLPTKRPHALLQRNRRKLRTFSNSFMIEILGLSFTTRLLSSRESSYLAYSWKLLITTAVFRCLLSRDHMIARIFLQMLSPRVPLKYANIYKENAHLLPWKILFLQLTTTQRSFY